MKIAVLGSMKSGKSTFINSIIGFDMMPVQVEACTAKIITIEDNDYEKKFKIYFTDNNNKKSAELIINGNKLKNIIQLWNGDKNISTISVEGNIKGLNNYKNKGIVLLDSPGADNYSDKTHKTIFNQFILKKNFDYICFVVDSTSLLSDAEDKIINNVIITIKDSFLQNNLIFVLNKIDQIDENSSLKDITEILRERLKKIYKINNPKIFPVSAYAAKVFKKALGSVKLSNKELSDLKMLSSRFESNDLGVSLEYYLERLTLNVLGNELIMKRKREYIEFPKKYKYYKTNSYEVNIRKQNFNSIQLFSCLKNSGIILIEDFLNKKLNINE